MYKKGLLFMGPNGAGRKDQVVFVIGRYKYHLELFFLLSFNPFFQPFITNTKTKHLDTRMSILV